MLGLRLNIYSIWISNIFVNNFKKFAIFFIKKKTTEHISRIIPAIHGKKLAINFDARFM